MFKSIWKRIVDFLNGPYVPPEEIERRKMEMSEYYYKNRDKPSQGYHDGGWSN